MAGMLRGELARRWTVNELAAAVHLSPSQLGRVFTRVFGKPPIAYLTMLRVERMAHLLRTTNMSVSVIAKEVGWDDADFASRQFRRNIGAPPTRYRAMSREHGGQLSDQSGAFTECRVEPCDLCSGSRSKRPPARAGARGS